jgi:hypothetical protein
VDGHSNGISGSRRGARGFVCRVVGGKRIGENGIPCDMPVGIQIARVQHWQVEQKETVRGVVGSATCLFDSGRSYVVGMICACRTAQTLLRLQILSNKRNMHQFLHIDEQTNSALRFDPQSFSV